MNSIKISIIIPVYNTEKYLKKCLETLINQTLKDIEIICIDDGSIDSSLQILQDFSNVDNRIKIIKHQHEGAGQARNIGLSIAQGKYLSFLDSDDFFESNMLEDLYNCAEKFNTDIVVCKSRLFENGWIKDNTDIKDELLPNKEVFSAKDISKYIFQFHMGWTWNKLYRKDFIKGLNIQFQNLKKHNDSFFSHISMINAKRIYVLDKRLIYYRKDISTSSKKQIIKNRNRFEFYKALQEIKKYLINNKLFKDFEQSYINYCIKLFVSYKNILPFSFNKSFFKNIGMSKYNKNFFYSTKFLAIYIIYSHSTLILLCNIFFKLKIFMQYLLKKIKTTRKITQKNTKQQNLKYFCVHIVDHCNLKCQFCDHFSPLAKEWYADLKSFENDFKRFSFLSKQKVDRIGLLGGEPLLHPQIIKFAEIARKYFPYSKINIVTNGLLLLTKDATFWENCRKNNITIAVTKYPINLNYEKILETANKYNVVLEFYNNSNKHKKTSYHLPLDLKGKQNDKDNFIRCFHANNLILLRDGKLYPCTIAPNAFKFNNFFNKNLPIPKGIDIHKAKDIDEILKFISKPINFCKYCYIKKRTFNHIWNRSNKNIKEWTV